MAAFSNCRPWQFYGQFSALWGFCSSNCQPWQFEPHFFSWTQTADLGSLTAAFSNCRPWQFDGRFSALWGFWSSNCRPWQFHGRFSAICPIHDEMHVLKLPTLAVSRPLFSTVTSNCRPWQFHGRFSALWELWLSNCRPWQFYGRFSAPIKSGHETANLGSVMASFFNLLSLAV